MLKQAFFTVIIFAFLGTHVQAQPDSAVSDSTLSAEAYQEHGVPDPDELWSTDELRQANLALHAIANENIQWLPRHDDEESGAVFDRIVSLENFLQHKDADIEVVAQKWGLMSQYFHPLLQLYIQAYEESGEYRTEIVDITGLILAMQDLMVEHFSPLLKDAEDNPESNMEQVRSGHRQMKQGASQSVIGTFMFISDPEFLSETLLHRVMDHLENPLPQLAAFVNDEQRELMIQWIDVALDEWGANDIADRLSGMRSVIVNADQ